MHEETAETERRATDVAGELDGKKTPILGLEGLEFLVMAGAGETGHWEILGKLNERAGLADVRELVEWALLIQQRHFEQARECSLQLAGEEDPNEPE
jgi:hypothetical protein